MSEWVIVREQTMTHPVTGKPYESVHYFMDIGLGIFWTCGTSPDNARRFARRAAAVKVLQANGKHREGWRVITAPPRAGTS